MTGRRSYFLNGRHGRLVSRRMLGVADVKEEKGQVRETSSELNAKVNQYIRSSLEIFYLISSKIR